MKEKMESLALDFRVNKAKDGNYWLDVKCGKDEAGYSPMDTLDLVKIIIETIGDWKLKKNKKRRKKQLCSTN